MIRSRATRAVRVHPLVTRVGAQTIVDSIPAAVMVVDNEGTVVHRSHFAEALGKQVTAERGKPVLDELRRQLATIVRDERTFPVTRICSAELDDRHAEIEIVVDRLVEGFVLVWRDVTASHDTGRATRSVATDLATSAGALNELSNQIAASAAELSNRSETVAASSEQMSASIREIAASASASASGTRNAVHAADDASRKLSKLAESSARVGDVSKLIAGIAGQTNLLALNATIEAARAGEAGKGFAVVAGEVKSLASSTRDATTEINEMIGTIQSDSADATHAIDEILRIIAGVEEQQATVASAVEEQTAVATEMSSNVAQVANAAALSASSVDGLRQSADFVAQQARELEAIVEH